MRSLIFVGSLTRDTPFFAPARGDGIHVYELDPDSGALTRLSVTGGADNPTYLALDRQQNLLYATSEVFEWHEGLVTSYAIDTATGTLTYINKQPTLGHLSAFVALDAAGRNLLVSNYSMQSSEVLPGRCLVVLPVDHGRIAPAASSVVRAGTGPIADRQERAHAHCLIPLPDGRLATADLGTDEVAFYAFDPGVGIISDRPVETVRLPPGSGPRHIACDSVGEQLFVLNELSSTVAVLRRRAPGGAFALAQLVSTLPDGVAGANRAAGIALSPCGRFLYASNRGHDSVMAFHIGADLARIGAHPSGGATPRSFAIDPSGRFLIVANQDGHTLKVLHVDPRSGTLSDSGVCVPMPSPMCVQTMRCETRGG